jgi:hypothetical protein
MTTSTTYDRAAILDENGPFDPHFMRETVRTLLRSLPLGTAEPQGWQDRRMSSALLALTALHPRDEIEIMFGVQALSAYHAAAACWRLGMIQRPATDGTRHFAAAANAARTFDAMIRGLERRQARPLSVPVGRPDPKTWEDAPHPGEVMRDWEQRCERDQHRPDPKPEPGAETDPEPTWTEEDIAEAEQTLEQDRIDQENEGLDIANTEGILPGGGMIMPEHPTPQQEAYMGRRLALMYKREIEENLKKGITKYPKIRGIRPGDLIP